jgi:uncharacterized membrane protein YeiH
MDSATGLLINDLLGRFVFTLEGAMAAIENKLDLWGLLALSLVTALGGGILTCSSAPFLR